MSYEVPRLDRSVARRVVFLTGAASGIGRATAHVFAREGARIALSDVNTEGVEEVAKAATPRPGRSMSPTRKRSSR